MKTLGGEGRIPAGTQVAADPEQAQELGSSSYYPQRMKVLDRSVPFEMVLRTSTLNSLTLGELTYASDVEIDCAELRTAYHVNVPLSGAIDSKVAHTLTQATPRVATIYRPTGHTLLRKWYAASRVLTIKIDRAAVEERLQSILGRSEPDTVDFDASLQIDSGLGAIWWRMVQQLDRELRSADRSAALTHYPLLARHLEDGVVMGLLFAAGHRYQDELQGPSEVLRPRTVKLVIDAIEEYPHRAFTAADLAGIGGCSVRRLQESFQEYVGMTPMAYLRDVRLDRVHAALITADPSTTGVAEIAHTWGFANLGRFAMAYKKKFGVAPSATLRV